MENKVDNHDSHCLFCYRVTKSFSEFSINDMNKKYKIQQRFFTLITRQLLNNISGNGISKREKEWCRNNLDALSQSLKNNNESDDAGLLKIVYFCKKCEVIAQQFCKLYHQVQQLKLQLDWKISKFSSKMRSGDKKNSVSPYSSNILDNSFDVLSKEEIRKTLKQSFITYHKVRKTTSFPRVQLSSVLINETEQDHVPSLFDPINLEESLVQPEAIECDDMTAVEFVEESNDGDIEVEHSTSTRKHEETLLVNLCPSSPQTVAPIQTNDQIPVIDLSQSSPPPISFPGKEDHSLVPTSNIKSPLAYKCPLCPYCSNFKRNLKMHNIKSHSDQYFGSAKLREVSNEHFKNCIGYLLNKTINDAPKIKSKFKCAFCVSTFSGERGAREHLALCHRSILEGKLVELQKSENISLILSSIPKKLIRIQNVGSHVCVVCSKLFLKRDYLERHQCVVHAEKYFESYKRPTVDDTVFRVKIINLINQGFSTIYPAVRDQKGRLQAKLRCHHCDQIFVSCGDIKYHLIFKHRQAIAKMLENMMSGEKTEGDTNLEILGTTAISMSAGTTKCSKVKLYSGTYVCPVCEKVFQEGHRLNKHQSFEHPEMFFESSNFLWKSQNNTFFKRLVDHFLVQETYQRFTKINTKSALKEQKKFKCTLCSNVLFNLKLAKIHLVLRHRKLMAGKLEYLQNSEKTKHDIEMELEDIQKAMPKSREKNFSTLTEQNVCKFCSKQFSRRSCLNKHVAFQHSVQFFERVKSPTLTVDQFNSCIQKMLSEQFENIPKSVDKVYGTVKWQCPFCPRLIIGLWRNTVKSHAVLCHLNELGEKLKAVQDDWIIQNLK